MAETQPLEMKIKEGDLVDKLINKCKRDRTTRVQTKTTRAVQWFSDGDKNRDVTYLASVALVS